MLRERFDRIEIIDLRGDLRAGERAGVENDQGVFNIQVGTAITLAIADGSQAEGALANITYNDTWAHQLYSSREKRDWLVAGAQQGRREGAVSIERGPLEDMRPRPFLNGTLLSLREAFAFTKSGMKSGNDDVFVSTVRQRLLPQVQSHLPALQSYLSERETYYAYRPLDRRWFYNDRALLNRPGPEMQRVWGQSNVGLYAMSFGTAAGPGVWCHGLVPDYHSFSNRGGYAFPLYDRRQGHGPHNLKPDLVAALTDAYGVAVTPEQVFDAILCLLSARSYTRRFAEDLEDVFPHVPFPSSPEVFTGAARIGLEIRAVETFARPPAEPYRQIARADTAPRGPLAPIEQLVDNGFALCADGSGRISNVPTDVWEFAVSGYRVLPRWLAAREGEIGPNFIPEMRDVAQRIAELIFLFGEADTILTATLADSLTREALGVEAGEAPQDDEQD